MWISFIFSLYPTNPELKKDDILFFSVWTIPQYNKIFQWPFPGNRLNPSKYVFQIVLSVFLEILRKKRKILLLFTVTYLSFSEYFYLWRSLSFRECWISIHFMLLTKIQNLSFCLLIPVLSRYSLTIWFHNFFCNLTSRKSWLFQRNPEGNFKFNLSILWGLGYMR